jgi:hypothetical protein
VDEDVINNITKPVLVYDGPDAQKTAAGAE